MIENLTLVVASEQEQPSLEKIETILENASNTLTNQRAKLVGSQGEEVELPPSVSQLLKRLVNYLSDGQAVNIVQIEKQLTTQAAANILNVSRPYLVKLLEQGQIPYQKVGTHRRVNLFDLLSYKKKRDEKRRQLLSELTEVSQDFGLYDE